MIDPIAFHIGPLAVRWYGLSYGVGLGVGLLILNALNKVEAKRYATAPFKDWNQILDFAFYLFLIGVILGGRLGYVLFYNLPYYFENPLKVFAIWEGGMSFHGGLIGSAIVAFFYFREHKIPFLKAADIAVIPGALALTFTRLANFVNQELCGRPIENPAWNNWGVQCGDTLLRWPSQIFQSIEALVLALLLLWIYSRKPKIGMVFFSYLTLNGLFRMVTELFRQPDLQIGYIARYWTLGQILGFLVFVAGLLGIFSRLSSNLRPPFPES
jgi:phosphatidylglycerol:prolipoprotein diacylglycerol transferase